MTSAHRGNGFLFTAAVVGVLLLAVVSGTAAAVSGPSVGVVPSALPTNDTWAYGVQKWFNLTVNTPNGVHTVHAFLAWYTIFSIVNTSASTSFLSVERLVVSNFNATYCAPSCTAPTVRVDLAHHSLESLRGYLNLTNQSTVYESGSPVTALGIVNASARASGAVNSSVKILLNTAQGARTVSAAYSAGGESAAGIAFTPSLGLLPNNLYTLTSGDSWNSSSSYAGYGGWSANWTYTKTNASGQTVSLSGNSTGSVASTGTVGVVGTVVGATSLGNSTLPSVTLVWIGPFNASEGFVLLPAGFSLFGSDAQGWANDSMGFASMAAHRYAVQFLNKHAFFHVRSATAYFGTSDDCIEWGDSGGMGPTDGHQGMMGAVGMETGIPSTEVTAWPVSVQAAQSAIGQYTPSSPSASAPASPWLYVGVGLAVAAVIVAIVVVIQADRRTRRVR